MIWVFRVLFSIASVGAISAAVYFSFFVPEADNAMTSIWLTFCLFTFLIGWPETVKSISFLGGSIELRELKKEVNNLSHLFGSYWKEIPRSFCTLASAFFSVFHDSLL